MKNLSNQLVLDEYSQDQEYLGKVVGHHDEYMGGSELMHKAIVRKHQIRGKE